MLKEMHIPLHLSEMLSISKQEYFAQIPQMAKKALADGCTATNPRTPTLQEIEQIYKDLW